MVPKPKQQGQQSQGQVIGVPNVDPQTAILVRVGLVEARACFWGYMIKSPTFYRFFGLEFRRAKRTNFLKDVGMFSDVFCKTQKTSRRVDNRSSSCPCFGIKCAWRHSAVIMSC